MKNLLSTSFPSPQEFRNYCSHFFEISILTAFNLLTSTNNSCTWRSRKMFSRNLNSKYINFRNFFIPSSSTLYLFSMYPKSLLSNWYWCRDRIINLKVRSECDLYRLIHLLCIFVFHSLQHPNLHLLVLVVVPNPDQECRRSSVPLERTSMHLATEWGLFHQTYPIEQGLNSWVWWLS